MRILVCIASYGVKNQHYLEYILENYRKISFDTELVVVSDHPRQLGKDVEVKVGLPNRNPHSLPFEHKRIFFNKADEFDLYIYSEDDILITENNIKNFLKLTNILPIDTISGFIRYEVDFYENKYCPDVITYYNWVINSVEKHGNELFAQFGNQHSAAYILTKKQLQNAINSSGYLVGPHKGDYDLECSAATDPYTQCGFRRLLCISRLEEIMIHHLSNSYIGIKGIGFEEVKKQVDVLIKSYSKGKKEGSLFSTRKGVNIRHWDKQFYEEPDRDILKILKGPNKEVLSIGAGYGGLEKAVKRLGHHVIAVPIDNLMAASLQYRGIDVTEPNFNSAFKQLKNSRFDCIILSNVLQHIKNPENLIDSVLALVKKNAILIVKIHNFNFWHWKSFRPINFDDSYLNCIDPKEIKEWLEERGFNVSIMPQGSDRVECLFNLVGPLMSSLIARSFVLAARK